MTTITRELITPEYAEELLRNNYEHNRKLGMGAVKAYASDMMTGLWNTNVVQPISITKDGVLIDGQHRLRAVVEYGSPVMMYVARGLDEKDIAFVDVGKPRKAADFIGGQYRSVVAAIAKICICADDGTAPIRTIVFGQMFSSHNANPTPSRVVKYCEAHAEMLEFCARLAKKVTNTRTIGATGKIGASFALLLMFGVVSRDFLENFVDEYHSLDAFDSAARDLRERYTKLRLAKSTECSNPLFILTTIYAAVKASQKGQRFKRFDKSLESSELDYLLKEYRNAKSKEILCMGGN